MKSLVVNEKYNGKNLNRFILDTFCELSQNDLYRALRKKDVKVNGKRVSQNINVYTGDCVDVFIADSILFPTHMNFEIVYEDEFILVVNKPVGMEVTGKDSLTTCLSKTYGIPVFPCHRLDRNTTGIVLFAKNEDVLAVLLEKFKNGEIEKHYACHVYGIPSVKKKMLTAYLFKDSKKAMVYISDTPKKGYRKIVTSYEVLKEFSDHTCLLDINLHTGRTHQIRAHLAHIGYPIIGDGKYGRNEINQIFHAKTQKLCSYQMKFCFTNPSILESLNGKEFKIDYSFA